MIVDRIENYKMYLGLNSGLKEGFEFLMSNNLPMLEDGRHEIDGDKVFAMVSSYNTKEHNETFPEAHDKYIDIQYIASGEEMMGYADRVEGLVVEKEYDEENDVLLFNEETYLIPFKKGTFFILYPNDLHQPGIELDDSDIVKKVVIKVLQEK